MFVDQPPLPLHSRGKLHHEHVHAVKQSHFHPIDSKCVRLLYSCMYSLTTSNQSIHPQVRMFCSSVKKNSCTCCGRKTNLLCSSGYRHDDPQIWIQKINFLIYKFVVAIIGCQKQTFCVVYNLPKGCVLWSELLIHLFNL